MWNWDKNQTTLLRRLREEQALRRTKYAGHEQNLHEPNLRPMVCRTLDSGMKFLLEQTRFFV